MLVENAGQEADMLTGMAVQTSVVDGMEDKRERERGQKGNEENADSAWMAPTRKVTLKTIEGRYRRDREMIGSGEAGSLCLQEQLSGDIQHPCSRLSSINHALRANSMQNSPHSLPPLVGKISSAIASSSLSPYRLRNSCLTCSRCFGSQCSLTSLEINNSDRSLPDRDSCNAWCRSRASRMGRLITPLRI